MGYNGHRYDLNQMNMVGHPLGMMSQMPPPTNQMPVNQMPQPSKINPQTTRPNGSEIPGSSLGFQMNPVSKNSKKK